MSVSERTRLIVLERDTWQCQVCGATLEMGSGKYAVHHISYENDEPENLISLCRDHHGDAHIAINRQHKEERQREVEKHQIEVNKEYWNNPLNVCYMCGFNVGGKWIDTNNVDDHLCYSCAMSILKGKFAEQCRNYQPPPLNETGNPYFGIPKKRSDST